MGLCNKNDGPLNARHHYYSQDQLFHDGSEQSCLTQLVCVVYRRRGSQLKCKSTKIGRNTNFSNMRAVGVQFTCQLSSGELPQQLRIASRGRLSLEPDAANTDE